MTTTTDSSDEPAERPLDVPAWLARSSAWAWRLTIVLIAVIGLAWLSLRLRVVVVPVLVATMLASVLVPFVGRLERRGMPRLAAVWVVLLSVFLAITALLGAAGWALTSELTSDRARWEEVGDDVRQWLRDGPLDLSQATIDDAENRARDAIAGGAASFGASRASLLIEFVGGALLSVAMTFFFVKDGPTMWSWIVERVHPSRRSVVDAAGHEAVVTLSAYLRAIAITGFVNAAVMTIALSIIGVPLAVPIGVITFFGAFLPIVGATIAGALAVVVALVANGVGAAVIVGVLTVVVQQVEGDVLMPVVMGRQVPLHPAAVLVALTAGAALAGVIGAFVAVPVAAIAAAAAPVVRGVKNPLSDV